jgi:cation diffusion facilitator CzcD-associated flavoprotein CzcO
MMRIAIVGGGPGGLLTAYELENRCGSMFEATLFEASHRIGGKIVTRQFASFSPLAAAALSTIAATSTVCPSGAAALTEHEQFSVDARRPPSGFSMLIRRISARRSVSICGRPPNGGDFHRQ